MLLRAITGLSLLCLTWVSGCSHCEPYIGHPAPDFTLCHGARLATEFGWLYADINDMLFGIDYYPGLNSRFGDGPYN